MIYNVLNIDCIPIIGYLIPKLNLEHADLKELIINYFVAGINRMPPSEKSLPSNNNGSSLSPSAEDILRQLQRILDSPEFNATKAQIAFLNFVVGKTLSGESDEIKGYTVATQVFGRKEDFDQNSDPIVSIHANKLRRALERYYLTAGIHDPLRIDVPKGTYVPVFYKQNEINAPAVSINDIKQSITYENAWPTVLIQPFKSLTGDSESNYMGIGLATELSTALARYQDVRVLMYGPEGNAKRIADTPARFVVEGSVRKDETKINVSVHLVDLISGMQILGESHNTDLKATQLIAFQEEFSRKIAVAIAGEHGAISRAMSSESKNKPPKELTTYEAILKYYEYDRFNNTETYIAALEALTSASKKEPDCGQIWTKLGRLYSDNITNEFFDTEITLEQAVSCASKGVLINPDNQRARIILAALRMFSDEVPAARAEAERALALNPNSLFFLDVTGYILTLLGDWERGTMLIKKAMSLNPYYHNYVHYALWLNLFRKKEYEPAYLETTNLTLTESLWEPLTRAATLGQLGRIEEGKRAAEELLTLKPEFQTRGRKLIKYYIKFDDIIEQVVDGLRKVGVAVA